MERTDRGFLALALTGLLATVAVGTLLRWTLAGFGWPEALGSWAHVRSAHTHLGYYGVVFPLAWAAWRRHDLPVPGPVSIGIYLAAVIASAVGFAGAGYARLSIVGSTLVLGIWLLSSLPLARFIPRRDWLAPAAPSVWLAALAIPGVAVISAQGGDATPLVRGFLTWLLLGIGVSAALRGRAAPVPGWLHIPLVLGSGLALGPWPHPVSWALLGAYGVMLLRVAVQGALSWPLRGLWGALGAGLVAVSFGWLLHNHPVAVSGIHFAVLGPLLATLAWPERWSRWLPAYGLLVSVFAGAILAPVVWPWAGWPTVSAATGTMVAAVWVVRAGWGLWRWAVPARTEQAQTRSLHA